MTIPIYEFNSFYIRSEIMEGIRRYIDDHKQPGDFLTAVICNDLREAVARADEDNMRNLPAFVAYFYNEAPSPCWGSREKMDAWLQAIPAQFSPQTTEVDEQALASLWEKGRKAWKDVKSAAGWVEALRGNE